MKTKSYKCRYCHDGESLPVGWKCSVCGFLNTASPQTDIEMAAYQANPPGVAKNKHVSDDYKQGRKDAASAIKSWSKAELELEAESIIMAVEVGMFHGTSGEYAHALLVIAGRDERESDK